MDIYDLRCRLGISRLAAGRMAGVSQSTICSWECGLVRPMAHKLVPYVES